MDVRETVTVSGGETGGSTPWGLSTFGSRSQASSGKRGVASVVLFEGRVVGRLGVGGPGQRPVFFL